MAVVAQIVCAAAVNRDRRRRRNPHWCAAGVFQRDRENLDIAVGRNKTQNLRRQAERLAAAPHTLPQKARRERSFLLDAREALRFLPRTCSHG